VWHALFTWPCPTEDIAIIAEAAALADFIYVFGALLKAPRHGHEQVPAPQQQQQQQQQLNSAK